MSEFPWRLEKFGAEILDVLAKSNNSVTQAAAAQTQRRQEANTSRIWGCFAARNERLRGKR